jgi:hypothetical protein
MDHCPQVHNDTIQPIGPQGIQPGDDHIQLIPEFAFHGLSPMIEPKGNKYERELV